jgi:hypothetical protein
MLTLPQCDGNTNTRPRADIIRISQAWCYFVFTQIRYSATLCGSQTRKVMESGNVRGQTVDYPSISFEICVLTGNWVDRRKLCLMTIRTAGFKWPRYSTGSEGVNHYTSTKDQRRRQYLEHNTHLVHDCVLLLWLPSTPFATPPSTHSQPIPRHPAPWMLDRRRSTDLDLCLIVDLCDPKVSSAAMPSHWKYNCIVRENTGTIGHLRYLLYPGDDASVHWHPRNPCNSPGSPTSRFSKVFLLRQLAWKTAWLSAIN